MRPMPLVRLADPFDDPAWIFEIKHDGFRGLAYCDLLPDRQSRLLYLDHIEHRGIDPPGGSVLIRSYSPSKIASVMSGAYSDGLETESM